MERVRWRLRFLQGRLLDVPHDLSLTATVRREKVNYYTKAIAKARPRLVEVKGH